MLFRSLFDTVETLRGCLRAYELMVPHIRVERERMRAAVDQGFTTATDLADYLVRRGVPFRDAHEVVGRAVRHAIDKGCDLGELALEDLRGFSTAIGEDVFEVLTPEGSLAARNHFGGTAPAQVREAVARVREALKH